MCKTYAYIRVSAIDQNISRQLDALAGWNIPRHNIFIDKQSGKDFERPNYKRLIKKLKPGDLVIIKSIDRLGRNYEEIIKQWQHITKEIRADILVLDMELLDTRREKNLLGTFIADLVLQVLSFVAQNERENIKRRQAEGIRAAQARGVICGRREREIPEFASILERLDAGELTSSAAAREAGMSRRGFDQRRERWRNRKS